MSGSRMTSIERSAICYPCTSCGANRHQWCRDRNDSVTAVLHRPRLDKALDVKMQREIAAERREWRRARAARKSSADPVDASSGVGVEATQ